MPWIPSVPLSCSFLLADIHGWHCGLLPAMPEVQGFLHLLAPEAGGGAALLKSVQGTSWQFELHRRCYPDERAGSLHCGLQAWGVVPLALLCAPIQLKQGHCAQVGNSAGLLVVAAAGSTQHAASCPCTWSSRTQKTRCPARQCLLLSASCTRLQITGSCQWPCGCAAGGLPLSAA